MEGQVQVPVVSATAGEPNCSFSASSETPRQGLGRTVPSPPRPRPGSSRILIASASIVPLAGCPIHLMPLRAPTTSATTGRVQQQERWDNGQIFFLPSLTDGAGVTVPCGHTSCTIPPKPSTTLTAEAPVSQAGHVQGLGWITNSPPRQWPRPRGLGQETDSPTRPRPRPKGLGRVTNAPPRSRRAQQTTPSPPSRPTTPTTSSG